MSSKPQRIEVVLETVIESIALAETLGVRIAAAAGFDEDDQYKIGLAVHEGVMNAFQYGNEQRRERKIHVIFELFNEKLVIHVADQGTVDTGLKMFQTLAKMKMCWANPDVGCC